MAEQQPYELIRDFGSFEVRRYPEHLLAEIVVDGPFDSAGNRAFRHLFAYLTGANGSQSRIAMTAPVIQIPEDGSSIGWVGVPQRDHADEAGGPDDVERYRVAFVLPEHFTGRSAPQPTDPAVHLRTVPGVVVAAARFGGLWNETRFRRHLQQLHADVRAAGMSPASVGRSARFDAPYVPWFLRHNEVLVDVTGFVEGEPPTST